MWRWIVLALALCASPALAQDSSCGTPYPSGEYLVVECKLCDGDHSATDCAEFDLVTEGRGLPSHLVASLDAVTDCSGSPSIQVRGLDRQLGVPQVYATLTQAGNSAVRIAPVRHRHLDADVDITTSAGCTDLEVSLILFYPSGAIRWND